MNMLQICQTCLSTGDTILPMSAEDMECYRLFVTKIEDPLDVTYICVYCRTMIRRIIKFIKQCHYADVLLKENRNSELHLSINSSQLTRSETVCQYVGPDFNVELKGEIKTCAEDEDDIPLVLLHQNKTLNRGIPYRNIYNLAASGVKHHYFGPDLDVSKEEAKTFHDEIPLGSVNCNIDGDSSNRYDDDINSDNTTDVHLESKAVSPKTNTRTDKKRNIKKIRKKKAIKEGFTSRMVMETNEYEVIKLSKEEILERMKQHMYSEKYKLMPYKCEKCVRGFNFEDVLNTHMEKHSPKNGPFQCELCTQYCPSRVSLRGHMKSHATRYKCKLCGMIRLSRQHILEHYSLEHTLSAALYTCPKCGHTTSKRTAMQKHMRLHSTTEPLKCHFCSKYYKSKESLRVHIMKHDDKKLHQCEVCSSTFVYAAQLTKHKQSVHVRRDYYCVECDIMFKSMYNLKQHLQRARRHRDETSYKFQCDNCDQRFISASTLATHQTNAHGAVKSETCTICSRRYSSTEALRWHTRRAHTALRTDKLPCPLCDRLFSRKYVLRVHMRTHTGERPHVCECGAAFAQPAALRAHRTATHKKPIIIGDAEV